MFPQMRCSFRGCRLWAAALLLLFVAGCASESPHHGRGSRQPPPPPLVGEETFFNGQITAELKVGAGVEFEGKADERGGGGGAREQHGGHGGGGFRAGGGFGGGFGAGGGGGGHHGGGGGAPPDGALGADRGMMMRPMPGAGGPPMMIHLRFINHGPEPAELLVADFLSPLGNFVVQPEKVSLAPGEAVEVEPMTSRLSADVGDIPVTLALRLRGQPEKKTIVLHVAPAAPPAGQTTPPPDAAPPK